MQIQARIKFRRDTEINWLSGNPVLLEGELALVLDAEPPYFKIGDGQTAFADLPIACGKAGQDGQDGQSAYEVAVERGFQGSEDEWLASLKGADGTDGNEGADGREVEVASDGTYIKWRYTGETDWTNLVALSALKGADG